MILDKNGHEHFLRGLVRPSLEFSCVGNIQQLDYTVMNQWGANVVRLPLNQDCWLNDPSNPSYDPTYEGRVDNQVQWAQGAGMDIILDLHGSDQGSYSVGQQCLTASSNCAQDMADSHSVTFWQQVATKYANVPYVLFELYNEPKIGSYQPVESDWTTWLSGGTSSGYTVVGMQTLYNTVRNTAKANNPVIIGGLNWAYDLTGVPTHAVQGTNIIYNTHPYQDKGDAAPDGWNTSFGFLTATYPVMATEFGNMSASQTQSSPPAATDCDKTFDTNLIAYMGLQSNSPPSHRMSWTAWAFYDAPNECTFPSLIYDSNDDPNAPGLVVQTALTSFSTTGSP